MDENLKVFLRDGIITIYNESERNIRISTPAGDNFIIKANTEIKYNANNIIFSILKRYIINYPEQIIFEEF